MGNSQTYYEKLLSQAFETYCCNLKERENTLTKTLGSEFERFVAECLFKQKGLSEGDKYDGIVGGGSDGGVDGIYVFIDGVNIRLEPEYEETQIKSLRENKDAKAEVVIFQAKKRMH